jgi:hypothetical protein
MKIKTVCTLLLIVIIASACTLNGPKGTLVFRNYGDVNATNQISTRYVTQNIGSYELGQGFNTYFDPQSNVFEYQLVNINGTIYGSWIDQLKPGENVTAHISVYDRSFKRKVFDFTVTDFPEGVEWAAGNIISGSDNKLYLTVFCMPIPENNQNAFYLVYKVLLKEQTLVRISQINLPKNYFITSMDGEKALVFDPIGMDNWYWNGKLSFATASGIVDLQTQDQSLGYPTLSPDSKQIFYNNEVVDGDTYKICLKAIPVNAPDSDPTILRCWEKQVDAVSLAWTANPDVSSIDILFSPNEKYLTVSFFDHVLPNMLMIYDISDQENPKLINEVATDYVSHMATWSPNSRWLAYYDNVDGNQPGYYALKVGTGERKVLLQDPSWTMEADFNSIFHVHTPLILSFWLP